MTRFSAQLVMGLALLMAGGMAAGCDKKKDEKEAATQATKDGDEGQGTTAASGDSATIAEMRAAKDEFCACKDMACTDGVMKKFEHLDEAGKKLSKDGQKQAMAVAMEIAQCLERIGSKTGPAATGDAGAAAADTTTDAPVGSKDEQAALDEMAQVQVEVCTCKDVACAQAVMDNHKKLEGTTKTFSKAGQDRAMKIAMDIASCMAKMEHGPE